MADKATEQIKFETEMLKLAAIVTVATGGSAIGLLLGEHTALRLGRTGDFHYTGVDGDSMALLSQHLPTHQSNTGARMNLTDWVALGMGATVMAAFVVLFWKVSSPHEKP
jgi:hypothetical protein